MNIDQRLEALTQTVELVASMQKETEKHMARLAEKSAEFEEGMTKIANVLANHDHPLDPGRQSPAMKFIERPRVGRSWHLLTADVHFCGGCGL